MSTGKYELLIKWPSGQSTLSGEITDQQYGEICLVLSPDHCAELTAIKAGQGVAVAPYGYLREVDGNVQLSIGALRPADRSGGIATPWAAIFAAPPAHADAVSVPRELLGRVLDPETGDEWSKACRELRSMLVRQDVKS